MIKFIFPASPLSEREIDPDFQGESVAAGASGFSVGILNLEELLAGNPRRAVARLQAEEGPVDCIYRGWMVPGAVYDQLDVALRDKGFTLRTTPQQYRRNHEFPGGYDALNDLTPKSVVIHSAEGLAPGEIVRKATQTLRGPVIIKDFVKSRKHEWLDACFIPDIADTVSATRVVSNFISRQGDALHGGVVVRAFVELEAVGMHPKSGMPIPLEFRTFFLDGEIVTTTEYWHELEYAHKASPPTSLLTEVGKRMGRGFYTADTALTRTGEWVVIEAGDGQVSQVPEKQSMMGFYTRLAELLT